MSKDKDYHSQGEKDYASGKDKQEPHDRGILEVFHIPSEQEKKDREEYNDGWENAKKQDKD